MSHADERKTIELIGKLLPYLDELGAYSFGAADFYNVIHSYRNFLLEKEDEDSDDVDLKLFSEEFQTVLKKEIKAVLRKVESKFELKTKKIKVEHTYLEAKKK